MSATAQAAAKAGKRPHRTAPVPSKSMPKGIPYIVGNEAAERFSYYGMKAILVVFMTQYLLDSNGNYDVMSEADAKAAFHFFGSAVYFFPIFGAIIADAFFGKYKTILSLSVVYCLGHLVLAIFETKFGLSLGLTLIAIGSGGIKPCVSAHVGDQFGKTNSHLLERVFQWFYFSINLGSAISTLLTPILLVEFGPSVAFGVPGLLMLIATIVFWMGRHEFVHIPPKGMEFVKEVFSGVGLKALGQLLVVYLFVAIFWALFDQTGSAWVLQAKQMDLYFLGIEWLPSQIQAVNPILVMLFIPLTAYVIYPGINKVFKLTPLRKISIGFFLTVPSFMIPAWVETQLEAGIQVNIGWQMLSYIIITMAEVFVSITCLEFSYTQAPKKMKSLVMSVFLMSVFLGNLFTAVVNLTIQDTTSVAKDLPPQAELPLKVDQSASFSLTCEPTDGSEDPLNWNGRVTLANTVYLPCQADGDCNPGQVCVDRADESVPVARYCEAKPCTDNAACDQGFLCEAGKCTENAAKILSFTAHKTAEPDFKSQDGTIPVAPNEAVTLTWEATNVKDGKCELSFQDKPVDAKGSVEVKRETAATYVLKCPAPNEGETAEARVEVNATTGMARRSIGLSKSKLPREGGETTLSWNVLNAKSCSVGKTTISLSNTGYYMFFAWSMLVAAILFIFVAMWFKPKTYIQDEEDPEAGDGEGTGDDAGDA